MQQFDITQILPRADPKPVKPKVHNPFPFDTKRLTQRLIREHYPELEHRLNGD
jgi:hypothetical protein